MGTGETPGSPANQEDGLLDEASSEANTLIAGRVGKEVVNVDEGK